MSIIQYCREPGDTDLGVLNNSWKTFENDPACIAARNAGDIDQPGDTDLGVLNNSWKTFENDPACIAARNAGDIDQPGDIEFGFLNNSWKTFENDPAYIAARNAITTSNVFSVVQNRDVLQNILHVYSNSCPNESKCSAQMFSGRCWMFAMCNVMRVKLREKFKLPEDFELSQGFLFFYDKLERCNYYLQSVIEMKDRATDDRLFSLFNKNMISDGGQWDMLTNIINKYGVCPKSVFPETYCCLNSKNMNKFLANRLRTDACKLRKYKDCSNTKLHDMKKNMMGHYHRILAIFFGKPPTQFDWEYYDKKHEYKMIRNLTPRTFYKKHIPVDLNNYVSLIHDPRNEYYQRYTVEYLGNVVGGTPICYINVPIEIMKTAVQESIDNKEPVWFGCDVRKCMQAHYGLLDTKLFDFKSTFGVGFGMNKAERLIYGESAMTHAMVFTAYDKKKDDSVRAWRVENSWGTLHGDKGYLCMTDAWFDQWVYQIAIDKRLLNSRVLLKSQVLDALKVLDVLKEKKAPIKLPYWDPMGALATN